MQGHKVPQGYSPADNNAGSLTPFGMTIRKKIIASSKELQKR
jgi:hypothetical protein